MYPIMSSYAAAQVKTDLADLLIEAIKDELQDYEKYRRMMEMAKDEKIRRQIEFAHKDEGKHARMFKNILYCLTGRMMDVPVPEIDLSGKLIKDVESSIDGELEAVELYRRIKSMLPGIQFRDMLYEIITDEQEHATRFVYLYSVLSHHDD